MEAAPETPQCEVEQQGSSNSSEPKPAKKIICRYGRGCTHIYDAVHRERFWHPSTPKLTAEDVKARHVCNECGSPFHTLGALKVHLVRKTAWSNQSLRGCRVSCLLDNREWHEGVVLKFEKGKHLLQFKTMDDKQFDKKWLNMQKVAFYIIERPSTSTNEIKELEADVEVAMPSEEWVFAEDVSLEYAYAQSMLYKLYGNVVQETGHKTKGHLCLTDADKEYAKIAKGSLLYGELLPRGVNKALGESHLRAHEAQSLFDLGMGTGKVALQAFLQFRNLRFVYGVELARGRYKVAEDALLQLATMQPHLYEVRLVPGKSVILIERSSHEQSQGGVSETKCAAGDSSDSESNAEVGSETNTRVLQFVCGNMMDTPNMHIADIVMLETDVPADIQADLCKMLARTREGARALTYLDLRRIWDGASIPFKQLDVNKQVTDRYPTSWSVQRGHHFYLWLSVGAKAESPRGVRISKSFDGSVANDEDRGHSCLGLGCVPRLLFRGCRFGRDRRRKTVNQEASVPAAQIPKIEDPAEDEFRTVQNDQQLVSEHAHDLVYAVLHAALDAHPQPVDPYDALVLPSLSSSASLPLPPPTSANTQVNEQAQEKTQVLSNGDTIGRSSRKDTPTADHSRAQSTSWGRLNDGMFIPPVLDHQASSARMLRSLSGDRMHAVAPYPQPEINTERSASTLIHPVQSSSAGVVDSRQQCCVS